MRKTPPLPHWAPKDTVIQDTDGEFSFDLDNITYTWRPHHEMWLPVIKIREKV